jgi:hypothetical protein
MNVFISIPIALYQALLGRCLLASREYAIIKNSVINHVPTNVRDGNIVEILCAIGDAELILNLAKRVYPAAIPYIEDAVRREGGQGFGASLPADTQELNHFRAGYRIKTAGDTWHFCSNCSQWPTADFVSSKELPGHDQICNECLVKQEHGECNSPQ